MKRIVIALGGNALQKRGEPLEASLMLKNAKLAAQSIATVANDYEIVIVHGNGPQVGLLALQNAAYHDVASYPLFLLDAQSQGMIGYSIANPLYNASGKNVATIVTQVQVDPNDGAFQNPTKYIGPVYTEDEKNSVSKEYPHWTFKSDTKGFRRVVPSPKPQTILELPTILELLSKETIVIAGGGGGIPVVEESQGQYQGVDAVIDKDLTGALLAKLIHAEQFVILTDVNGVYENFGTPDEKLLSDIDVHATPAHQYPAGSMGPKVAACVQFTAQTGKSASIGSLTELSDLLEGKSGTHFH